MPLIFLNELSCGTACAPARADRAMTELVRAVAAVARSDRPGTTLVSKDPITGLLLAEGHPIGKWHGNPRNKELWQRLLLMQSKYPHRVVFPEGTDAYDIEYRHEGDVAEGLGAAHLMDGLGVSLPVEARWDADELTLEREQLVEEDDGNTGARVSAVRVRHLSNPEHCATHHGWILEGVAAVRAGGLASVRRGDELWERRAELFPHLQFIPRVEHDLRQMPVEWVAAVRNRLRDLDETSAAWERDASRSEPVWRIWVRPEGETRELFCRFEDEGVRRLFEWHCRFSPKPGRIHFRLVPEQRVLRIGYVGRKLGV
ncbi:hypothetical protein ACL02R_15000 [Streptomyces sp. MS19]|uniref:hypothetical protein n=1 Tax=Streptomyces sp. MS19 TaxID=3385972 RepID=UPI0039A38E59